MSEKLSSSEPAVKSDEEFVRVRNEEKFLRGSKEVIWKKNEPKRTMEYVKATGRSTTYGGECRHPDLKDSEYVKFRRLAGLPEPLIETSEGEKICLDCWKRKKRTMKDTEDFNFDSEDYEDSEDPEDPEDPEVAKICPCSSKEKKQIPEDSDDPKDPEVPKICQLPKTTSEISTSNKPEDPEVAKICPCFSKEKKQIPEDSDDPKDPEVLKICQLSETTSEIFTFKVEDLEDAEVCMPKIYQLPKTTSEISTSVEEDIPKVPKVCQLPETSEISTSVKFETSEIPDVCNLCNTTPLEISPVKFTDPEISECQLPKAMSKIPTPIKLETSKIPEIYQLPKTESECSAFIKTITVYETKPKASQLRKATSEISTSSKPEDPKIPESLQTCSIPELFALKHGAFKEVCEFPKTTCKIPTSNKPPSEVFKTLKNEDSLFGCVSKQSQQTMERVPYYDQPLKLPNESDQEYRIRVAEQIKPISYFNKELEEICHLTKRTSLNKSESLKKSEESSLPDDEDKTELMSIISGERPMDTLNKIWAPLGTPNFKKRPFVLATYQLVPSMPIGLFEMFAEIIEYLTMRHVVLLHECKFHRPIPSEIADIVIMPAAYNWDEGVLLPASFVFKHEQNKDKTANVYADVVVAKDCNPHIKSIIDLRGYTFVLPIIERSELTVTDLLFNFLHGKGENLLFFGNILEARTQIDVLDMVANNRAEAGVLDSPVIESNKYNIQGVTMKSLRILSSLGPLPPYRIMVKKTLADELVEKLANYLLTGLSDLWLERLLPYGVLGFAENSMDKYKYLDPKAATRTPRYY